MSAKPKRRSKASRAHRSMVLRSEEALQRIDKLVPRSELASALSSQSDQRFILLVQRLLDPDYSKHKLSTLCRSLDLNIRDMVEGFRDAKILEGWLRASLHLPDVMEDVAIDAKSRQVVCARCEGSGKIFRGKGDDAEQVNCPECSGDGQVRKSGDKDARNLMFESIGLTGKRGPLIAQQFNTLDGTESLETLMKATQPLLGGPKPALPAAPVVDAPVEAE